MELMIGDFEGCRSQPAPVGSWRAAPGVLNPFKYVESSLEKPGDM